MFKKRISIALSLFLFILFSSQVYAKTIESKITNEHSKAWKINFNQAIDKDSVTKESVYIKTTSGRLPAILSISDNLKQISVKPENKYEIGLNYQVIITKEVMSNKGVKLKDNVIMDFSYEGVHISNIEAVLNPLLTNITVKTSSVITKVDVSINGSKNQNLLKSNVSQFSKGIMGLALGDVLVIHAYDENGQLLEEQTYTIKK